MLSEALTRRSGRKGGRRRRAWTSSLLAGFPRLVFCACWAMFAASPLAASPLAASSAGLLHERSAAPSEFEECTIAVVGSSASADGRPLLWKNRDTSNRDNEVVYFEDGKYPYVALVNAGETYRVWIGINQAGFAVLNALSYNLTSNVWSGITNGELMKLALQSCADLDDFEALMDETNGRRLNPANLAVLDATGRAALFEAGGESYVRFDADDPKDAPDGLIVRANFSLSADTTAVESWRFRRAGELLNQHAMEGAVEIRHLLDAARDLVSAELDPYPLPSDEAPPGYPEAVGYVSTQETINRRSSAAFGLIHGVRPGENPALTTFFAGLGQPVVTPVLPFWVDAGPTPPAVDGEETSPLNDLTRDRILSLYNYPPNGLLLDTEGLTTASDSVEAPLPLAERIEARVLAETYYHLALWRESCACPDRLKKAEWDLAAMVLEEYGGALPENQAAATGVQITFRPNPSRDGVWLALDPQGSVPVVWRIALFDAAGRKVAEIIEPDAMPGRPSARRYLYWDGRGLSGRRVPAGIYFGRSLELPSAKGLRMIRLD